MQRRLFSLVLLGMLCAPAWATPSDVLARITQHLQQHTIVRAQFTQTREMKALRQPFVTKGRMIFSRRDGVYWLIDSPIQTGYWMSESRMVEINANGQRKEQDSKSNPALAHMGRIMRSMLSAQADVLAENFQLAADGTASQWVLTLTPRNPQLGQFIKRIRIQGGQFIDSMELEETSGDITRTRFRQSQALHQLPSAETRPFH